MNKKTKQKDSSLPPWFVSPPRRSAQRRRTTRASLEQRIVLPSGQNSPKRGWIKITTDDLTSICPHKYYFKTDKPESNTQSNNRIWIRFPNEFSLSVVYGHGLYSTDSKGNRFQKLNSSDEHATSVEIAIVDPNGDFLQFKDGETVKGFVNVTELLTIINWVSTQPSSDTQTQERLVTSNA